MTKSIQGITKKGRGRPRTTGPGTGIMVRAQDDLLAALDDWIDGQREADLSRPEAIRRLVEIGLAAGKPAARPTSPAKKNTERAAELAAKTIDKKLDPAAPPAEREVRKRKLLQGPSMVREARRDRPK